MLDDIDLEPTDTSPPNFSQRLRDVSGNLLPNQDPETLEIGAFRGMLFALPLAIFLWVIAGGVIYLIL